MSYYDSAYSDRVPITIDATGAAGTVDWELVVPPTWTRFWSTIQSDGDDIRITDSDGVTVLSYAWSGFVYATETGTIQVDGHALGATTGAHAAWLYYGNSSATDGSVAVTITSAKTAYIAIEKPTRHILSAAPEKPRAAAPFQEIHKDSAGVELLYWEIGSQLLRRGAGDEHNNHRELEEVDYIVWDVTDGAASQAALFDATETRIVQDSSGKLWARTYVKAGTSGTDYTGELTIVTTGFATAGVRTLEARVIIHVKDLKETT